VTSLFELEKTGDVDQITSLLTNSNSEPVRRRAADILGEVDASDEAVVGPLVTAAQNDSSEAVRAAAIDALDRVALVETLSADQPELRMASANALGRIGNKAGTKALVKHLGDPDQRVRARAARALGRPSLIHL